MHPRLILCFLLFMGAAQNTIAFTFSTPEDTCMNTLTWALQYYEKETGKLPTSWAEFDAHIGTPDYLGSSPVNPRGRYAFLPPGSRPQLDGRRGEIILISRRPFRNITVSQNFLGFRTRTLTEPVRYGLRRTSDGRIGSITLKEPAVQQIFQKQRITLPEPDTLPERPWIAERERAQKGQKIVMASLFVAGLGLFGFKLRKRFASK